MYYNFTFDRFPLEDDLINFLFIGKSKTRDDKIERPNGQPRYCYGYVLVLYHSANRRPSDCGFCRVLLFFVPRRSGRKVRNFYYQEDYGTVWYGVPHHRGRGGSSPSSARTDSFLSRHFRIRNNRRTNTPIVC